LYSYAIELIERKIPPSLKLFWSVPAIFPNTMSQAEIFAKLSPNFRYITFFFAFQRRVPSEIDLLYFFLVFLIRLSDGSDFFIPRKQSLLFHPRKVREARQTKELVRCSVTV